MITNKNGSAQRVPILTGTTKQQNQQTSEGDVSQAQFVHAYTVLHREELSLSNISENTCVCGLWVWRGF